MTQTSSRTQRVAQIVTRLERAETTHPEPDGRRVLCDERLAVMAQAQELTRIRQDARASGQLGSGVVVREAEERLAERVAEAEHTLALWASDRPFYAPQPRTHS